MLCCGWKPFCGHKNNRKKRRMGRKPCASFLGYQNFQPRTAVSGANFELVPFEAPSIGRMPLGNPCWTLRALFAARFSECNFGSAAPLRGDLHSRCFARFYDLVPRLEYGSNDGRASLCPRSRGFASLLQPVPFRARFRLCTASWCPQPSMLRVFLPLWPWLLQSSPCGASAFPLYRNLPNRCPAFSLVFPTACLDGTARSVPARR